MTKKAQKTSHTNPTKDCDALVHDNVSSEVKELSFEDTVVTFKNPDGKWRISLRQLAEYYSIPFSKASQKLTTNKELFQDLGADTVTVSANGSAYDYDLSIRDAFSFLTTLNYKKYEIERREKLIRMRNWLTDNAEKILTGQIPSSGYLPNLEKIEQLQGDYGDHSFLTGMVTKMIRSARRKYLDARCPSEQEIYQEDYNDVKGPGKLIPNWRKDLSQKQGKSLAVKKYFQGFQIWAGHLEKEDIRRRVIADIEEFCPQNKPEFMPSLKQLDPTKQMKLTGECEA